MAQKDPSSLDSWCMLSTAPSWGLFILVLGDCQTDLPPHPSSLPPLECDKDCFTFGCKWKVSPFQTHFQVGTGSYHLLCPSSEQEMALGVRESCHCKKVVQFIVSLQHFHQDKRKTLLLLVSTRSLLPDLGTFPTSHPTLLDCLLFQSDQFTSKDWIAIHCILPQFLSSWWVLKHGQVRHVSYSVCDCVCSPL